MHGPINIKCYEGLTVFVP